MLILDFLENKGLGLLKSLWDLPKGLFHSVKLLIVLITHSIFIFIAYLILRIVEIIPLSIGIKSILLKYIKYYVNQNVSFAFSPYFPDEMLLIYDKRILDSQKNIIISNHLWDFDWIFITRIMDHFNKLRDIFVVLKSDIRKIPLVGYVIEKFDYIFIDRREDGPKANRILNPSEIIENFEKKLVKLKNLNPFNILIFPEGCYPLNGTYYRAQKYADLKEENGEPLPFYPTRVLIPKSGGFESIKNTIPDFDGVIDFTFFPHPYKASIKDSDFSIKNMFFDGSHKISFHFLISYFPKNEIGSTFLMDSFLQKQNLLEKFSASNKNYDSPIDFTTFISEAGIINNESSEYIHVPIKLRPDCWSFLLIANIFLYFFFYLILSKIYNTMKYLYARLKKVVYSRFFFSSGQASKLK